jgi:hypothetical protein
VLEVLPVDHVYVYGLVPPLTFILALPLLLQFDPLVEIVEVIFPVDWEIDNVWVTIQVFEGAEEEMVYVPGEVTV